MQQNPCLDRRPPVGYSLIKGRTVRRLRRVRAACRKSPTARSVVRRIASIAAVVVMIVALGTFAVVLHPRRVALAASGSVVASTAPVASTQTTLRFTDAMVVEFGYGAQRVLATDLSGDGNPDLASVDWYPGADFGLVDQSTVSVLLGKGNGGFRKRAFYRTPRGVAGITAADVNRDGRPDLIAASADHAGSISVFLNRGAGRFKGRPTRSWSLPQAQSVAAGGLGPGGQGGPRKGPQ